MKILNVVGARPNMMKIAPLVTAIQNHPTAEQILLHTGQHYDQKMSQIFFDELGIPKPDVYLGVGSASHAVQTAKIMVAFEEVLQQHQPDIVVVVGDVNSTVACSLTATKMHIPVAHIEAGLRSGDRAMPEEINRLVVDAISDYLFTTSRGASENLRHEGVPDDKIFFVGNLMIDTLNQQKERAQKLQTPAQFNLEPNNYALLTLHRPSNVDDPQALSSLLDALTQIQRDLPILFPAHPRTRTRIREFGFDEKLAAAPNLRLIEAQGYLNFLDLMMHAKLMLTDSGGIQEETTCLGVPCLTIRENTERPITITAGTNQLVGTNPQKIVAAAQNILQTGGKAGQIPELWDGNTAVRIVDILAEKLG